jgi:chromosome segregation ATPase
VVLKQQLAELAEKHEADRRAIRSMTEEQSKLLSEQRRLQEELMEEKGSNDVLSRKLALQCAVHEHSVQNLQRQLHCAEAETAAALQRLDEVSAAQRTASDEAIKRREETVQAQHHMQLLQMELDRASHQLLLVDTRATEREKHLYAQVVDLNDKLRLAQETTMLNEYKSGRAGGPTMSMVDDLSFQVETLKKQEDEVCLFLRGIVEECCASHEKIGGSPSTSMGTPLNLREVLHELAKAVRRLQ